MAAIWGILSHSESNIQPELSVSMKKRMEKYKIDRIDDLLSDKFYFACVQQQPIKPKIFISEEHLIMNSPMEMK